MLSPLIAQIGITRPRHGFIGMMQGQALTRFVTGISSRSELAGRKLRPHEAVLNTHEAMGRAWHRTGIGTKRLAPFTLAGDNRESMARMTQTKGF
ncbi:MAG: hypothetical protein Kow0099_31430 [Candidatus Abyssubacteria bacterium]